MASQVETIHSLPAKARKLYSEFGQQKEMGSSAPGPANPHYFLLRTFRGENDLLIILNTKRCAFQCHFCQLPMKSSKSWIADVDVIAQVGHVFDEVRHSLSILDRVTIGNEGSVLDTTTLSTNVLEQLFAAARELRRVRTIVLETRLEFVDPKILRMLQEIAPRARINILTGFETKNETIRNETLYKRESLDTFLRGLDNVALSGARLTAYVLFKPSPTMTDEEAFAEADLSIDYLVEHTSRRGIELEIRLNPMYLADGTRWTRTALRTPAYRPPRLTDVMRLAEKKAQQGVSMYIGLSAEGLAGENGTYSSREDYSPRLIRPVKLFNDGKIKAFDWAALGT